MILFFLGIEFFSYSHSTPTAPPVEAPIPSPNGATAFVGSLNVIFSNPSPGSILYSVNGLPVTLLNNLRFSPDSSIKIEKTTTLRAVRNYKGQLGPETITQFTQATVSSPVAKYGLSPNFYPSVLCTLEVSKFNGNNPIVRYTLDGSVPNNASTPYTAPILFKISTVLKAYASLTGYQDSPPISINFNLLTPPSAPVATPAGGNFSTKSLMIKFLPQPPGVVIRYSTKPNEPLAAAQILTTDSIFLVGNNPGDSIVLSAQAFNQSYGIASTVMTGHYMYEPPVVAPTASVDTGFFYDSTSVTLSTTTPNAIIRYTLDGSPVTKNSSTIQPIPITETTKITAIAFKDNQPNSSAYNGNFTLRLTPPTVNPPGPKQFADVLNVKLTSACPGANIFYTLDGKTTPSSASTPISLDPNVLISVDNTTLMAIVIKGAVSSPVSINLYTKSPSIFNVAPPVIQPLSRDFYDSVTIHIKSQDPTAQVRYTLDGSVPTLTSTLYQDPFVIKESRITKARAFPITGNSEASLVREEIFTQLPSPPIATPNANSGPFQNQVDITLTTKTLNGKIFYCRGEQPCDLNSGTLYHPGEIISINSNMQLQAKTVLGTGSEQKTSGTLVQNYEVYTNQSNDTLAAGSLRTLFGGFEFANTGATPILTKIHSTETFGITGFKDAEIGILIQTIPSGNSLHVIFTKPPNKTPALYQVINGSVRFVTADAHFEITTAGDYFMGTDTVPPIISLKSQIPNNLGSTVVILSLKDNVISPTCEITSPGLSGGKLTQKPDSLGNLTLVFQNPIGDPKALWFQAQAFDFCDPAPRR